MLDAKLLRGALAAALLLLSEPCAAQCGPAGCFVPPPARFSDAVRAAFDSEVRIVHESSGGATLGSGAVVGTAAGGSYVLTCAHLFDASGRTSVLVSGRRFAARVIQIDQRHDLALLRTDGQPGRAVTVSVGRTSGVLTACGFGSTGSFRHVTGAVVGAAVAQGAESPSLRIRGAVRSGDSGGPVFDASGRLVAVVWGCRDGETFAMGGPPLQRIVERIRSIRPLTPVQPERIGSGRPAVRDKGQQELERAVADVTSRLDASIARAGEQLAAISQRIEQRLDDFAQLPPPGEARPPSHSTPWLSLIGRRSTRTLIQMGGPIVAAAVVASWWLWRSRSAGPGPSSSDRRRRTAVAPIAVDSPPPPQRVVPETHYVSYEKDDFARAHQWASEQLTRKFPGSVELLTSLDSLIRQKLNGSKPS